MINIPTAAYGKLIDGRVAEMIPIQTSGHGPPESATGLGIAVTPNDHTDMEK